MSIHRVWEDLPASVRDAVERHVGQVIKTDHASAGRNSDLTVSLWTADGVVFVKGIAADAPNVYMHRAEAAVSAFLPSDLAPQLLWEIEEDGWYLLGFEHVAGRPADYEPGSSDLSLVAEAVRIIGRTAAPPLGVARRVMAQQWATALKGALNTKLPDDAHPWSVTNITLLAEWAAQAPAHMGGSNLIHSDLHSTNVLVSDRARLVDWAWWRSGAAWIDPAMLIIRLIAEGHRPEHAENWARQFAGFAQASAEALTVFAASVLRLWERKFPTTDATAAARQWAKYRLSQH
ncbi:hypothetical protein JOF56_005594 [Kibdelosporangium banguiense]|uniref:Aminoglycoside phosphotransferase domain-containing protein n=1 Tax=Kibdelosporangium banguiense TaxID=1365924 RepID=A0ABS4TMH9_9PSEU|nr:phosphotransferase [Kibdelosporangium banguiense]MBP2325209.1 hypothetical protein [Kibdelosporangium banguiense]